MDKNDMSAVGFYFTDRETWFFVHSVEWRLGGGSKEMNPFRDHRLWSPSCGFIKGFIVGNIIIGSDGQPGTSSSSSLSQETNRSYDCVCRPYSELSQNSGPDQGRSRYLQYHGTPQYVNLASSENVLHLQAVWWTRACWQQQWCKAYMSFKLHFRLNTKLYGGTTELQAAL